ncbi:hypothetical protein AK825_13515 [Psychrobacter sp. P11G5]|nr:hypothetical protein AK825_13515 [Psychrobacter sp. P11G5]
MSTALCSEGIVETEFVAQPAISTADSGRIAKIIFKLHRVLSTLVIHKKILRHLIYIRWRRIQYDK